MIVTKSIRTEIKKIGEHQGCDLESLKNTTRIYNKAVEFFVLVINAHFKNIEGRGNDLLIYVEDLILKTKANQKVHGMYYKEYEEKFHKMPAMIRRAAIKDAEGHVKSFRTRLTLYKQKMDNWKPKRTKKGKLTKKPKAPKIGHQLRKSPIFYKGAYDFLHGATFWEIANKAKDKMSEEEIKEILKEAKQSKKKQMAENILKDKCKGEIEALSFVEREELAKIIKKYANDIKSQIENKKKIGIGVKLKQQKGELENGHLKIRLKVYKKTKEGNMEWQSESFVLEKKSFNKRGIEEAKRKSPRLKIIRNKMFLDIPFEKNVKLCDEKSQKEIVVGVDLNLNKAAVCSAITACGTVIGRRFIDFPIEKDRIKKQVAKINHRKSTEKTASSKKDIYPKYLQKNIPEQYIKYFVKTGTNKKTLYRRLCHLKNSYTQKIVNEIIDFAIANKASYICFEKLQQNFSKKKKFLKERMHHWQKHTIQNKTENKAHFHGIRIRRVLAAGTSMYAFDGSGEIKRPNPSKALAIFQNGKRYSADLSASYNIAARLHIKNIKNSLSEKRFNKIKDSIIDQKIKQLPRDCINANPVTGIDNNIDRTKYDCLGIRKFNTLDTLRRIGSFLYSGENSANSLSNGSLQLSSRNLKPLP